MEESEAKLKKQEEIIDILMEEVRRLKAELVKYKLIKELVNSESENFLVERKRQGIDLGYVCDGSCKGIKETNQEVQGKAKTSQCWICGLKTHELFERNRGKSSSYFCCVDCYGDVEKDTERIQGRESQLSAQNLIIKKKKKN